MQELERSTRVTRVEFSRENEKNIGYFLIKRIIDIIGALAGILIVSPVMIVVGIWIKLDSKGPVFLLKTELDKMVRDLRCISLDQCAWMQNAF